MSVFTNPASSSLQQAKAYTSAVLELVGSQDPLGVLERTRGEVQSIIEGLSDQQLKTPEAAGKWSIVEVLQHLADSEIVWGWRLRLVLAQDRPVLTGYDQDLWAERLFYGEANADEALEVWSVLRKAHLRLLRRLDSEDLGRIGLHSERGEESVQHMIRLYAGHDLLHVRQLQRIRQVLDGRSSNDT
jgi:uncharacterized damage-inducible protein DinB